MSSGTRNRVWIAPLLLAAALVLRVGWRAIDTWREEAIAEQLRMQGADVSFGASVADALLFGPLPAGVVFNGERAPAADVLLASRLRGLKSLAFFDMTLPDNFAEAAKRMGSLDYLMVSGTSGSSDAWKGVARLNKLFTVWIADTRLDEETMKYIASAPSLAVVFIQRTEVSDNGLAHFQGHKTLWRLGLDRCPVTERSVESLTDIPALESLSLSNCNIRKPPWHVLGRLPSLRTLSLDGNPIDDDGLAGISTMSNLGVLDLRKTRITDKGLRHLVGMPWLWWLEVAETRVTEEGVNWLRRQMPHVSIILHQGLTGATLLKENKRTIENRWESKRGPTLSSRG